MIGIILLIATSLFGYLLGSVNIAMLFANKRGVNLLSEGTQNPGTMNAIHTMGLSTGIIVLLFDIAKAIIPYCVARILNPNLIWAAPLASALAVVGHVFPCWNKFKGGKGLASLIGFMIATAPAWLSLAIIVGCLAISFATNGARWVIPLGCITYAGFAPFVFTDIVCVIIAIAAVALVVVKNIPVVKHETAGSNYTFRDVFGKK